MLIKKAMSNTGDIILYKLIPDAFIAVISLFLKRRLKQEIVASKTATGVIRKATKGILYTKYITPVRMGNFFSPSIGSISKTSVIRIIPVKKIKPQRKNLRKVFLMYR